MMCLDDFDIDAVAEDRGGCLQQLKAKVYTDAHVRGVYDGNLLCCLLQLLLECRIATRGADHHFLAVGGTEVDMMRGSGWMRKVDQDIKQAGVELARD